MAKQIKLLREIAGPDGVFAEGAIVTVGEDFDPAIAQALVNAEYAEEVKDPLKTQPLKTEAAAIEPPETTAKKPARKRKATKKSGE